jgi:hypothetical protein
VAAFAHRDRIKLQATLVVGCLGIWCWMVAGASAQSVTLGTAPSGLYGLVRSGSPISPPELNMSATAGFGLMGSVEPANGKHPRALGSLAVAVSPRRWLAFALRLDGRWDFHAGEGSGDYNGAVGDPRLYARAGTEVSEAVSLGAELGVWFPGRDAPSIVPSATTLDLLGLFALRPKGSAWSLLASGGFRLDNSANSAPDLQRLRDGDRLALGLSDFNAVLAGLGVAYRFGADGEVFAEFSGDFLVGQGAPPLGESPLRAAFGGRYLITGALQAELTSTVGLSSRPVAGPGDPLVPIDPRFSIVAGLRYAFGVFRSEPLAGATEVGVEGDAGQGWPLTGTLVDDTGEPVTEAEVIVRAGAARESRTITDAQGRYHFGDVPAGPVQVEVRATGFDVSRWQATVPESHAQEPRVLRRGGATTGLMRGLIRSFGSEPLSAHVQFKTRAGKVVATAETDSAGRFEVELPAGSYQVAISATGYVTHKVSVVVESRGVAILNVDMRERQ